MHDQEDSPLDSSALPCSRAAMIIRMNTRWLKHSDVSVRRSSQTVSKPHETKVQDVVNNTDSNEEFYQSDYMPDGFPSIRQYVIEEIEPVGAVLCLRGLRLRGMSKATL
jgi:hypothetical protein